MNLQSYKELLNTRTIEKELLVREKEGLVTRLAEAVELHVDLTEARDIMSSVSILAQQDTKRIIEELVTQALQSIFGEDHSFELEDKIARNSPETEMYVVIDGKRRSLKEDLGGGIIDVISFALRIVLWAVNTDRTDNVIILDEPLKFVSRDRLSLCGEMIQNLSEMMGLQFIIVTHEDLLEEVADKLFKVTQTNNISTVEEVVVQ